MQKLRKNIEEYLFIHVDTVAKKPTLQTQEEIREYKNFRRMQESSFSTDILTDYKDKAYMFAMYNRIATITVAYVKEGQLRVNTIIGKNDRDILKEFYNIINKTPALTLCGYNMVSYQLPMLRKKALSNGFSLLDIPGRILDSLRKPWDLTDAFLELQEAYKGTWPYFTTLEEACKEIGIVSWKGKTIEREQMTRSFHSKEGISDVVNHSRVVMMGQIIPFFSRIMGQEGATDNKKTFIKVTNASAKKPQKRQPKKEKKVSDDFAIDQLFKKGEPGYIDSETYPFIKEKVKSIKTKVGRERAIEIIYAQLDFPENNNYLEKLKKEVL